MSSEHPPPGDADPAAPGAGPERPTGRLTKEQWVEENRRRGTPEGRAALYRDPKLGRVAKPRANQTMANWALVLALAFCIPFGFLVAVGLAITVLVRGRDGRDHGQGKAVGALVVSGLLVVGYAVYVVATVFSPFVETDDSDPDDVAVEAASVPIDQVRSGDCLVGPALDEAPEDGADAEAPTVVDVVPCAEPHQAEMFHEIVLDDGDFPGRAAIDAGRRECLTEFRDYVGVPHQRSELEIVSYVPTVETWRLGDREINCHLVDPDAGDLIGSMAGSLR